MRIDVAGMIEQIAELNSSSVSRTISFLREMTAPVLTERYPAARPRRLRHGRVGDWDLEELPRGV